MTDALSDVRCRCIVIRLDDHYVATCSQCDAITNDRCGLPVDDTGEVVANDYPGDWGGVAACRRCFDIHAAGGPAALEAFLKHTPCTCAAIEAHMPDGFVNPEGAHEWRDAYGHFPACPRSPGIPA